MSLEAFIKCYHKQVNPRDLARRSNSYGPKKSLQKSFVRPEMSDLKNPRLDTYKKPVNFRSDTEEFTPDQHRQMAAHHFEGHLMAQKDGKQGLANAHSTAYNMHLQALMRAGT